MKNLVVAIIMALCLNCLVLALDNGDVKQGGLNAKYLTPGTAGPIVGPVVTVFELDTSVSVDSFGRAGSGRSIGSGLRITGRDNILFEHQDYISHPSIAGGAVVPINPDHCTIVDPIALVPELPDHGNSSVQCGACRINFHHATEGVSLTGWFTIVTIHGCQPSCYYSYTDFDINGAANNGGSWHAGEGLEPGSLGQFVVRNNVTDPNIHYVFAAHPTIASIDPDTRANHFQQGAFPDVRSFIEGSTAGCRDLSDGPATFPNGDWTAAFQYAFTHVGTEANPLIVRYSQRRDDNISFP